jgi:hypothetical protein
MDRPWHDHLVICLGLAQWWRGSTDAAKSSLKSTAPRIHELIERLVAAQAKAEADLRAKTGR